MSYLIPGSFKLRGGSLVFVIVENWNSFLKNPKPYNLREIQQKLEEASRINPIHNRSLFFTAMMKSHSVAFLLICSILLAISSSAVVAGAGDHHHHLGLGLVRAKSSCDGSIAECFGANEFEFDSEINRRILATSQYISYGALQRNTVPCSRRGASYYNCRPGAQANPYNRGCSAITRCRS